MHTYYKSNFRFLLPAFGALLISIQVWSQGSVKIGSAAPPHPSAILDIQVENYGVMIPEVSLTNALKAAPVISPANGLLVYSEASLDSGLLGQGFYYWEGRWKKLLAESDTWKYTGNYNLNYSFWFGFTSGQNKLGTQDDADLIFKRNNTRAGMIGSTNTALGLNALSNGSLSGVYNSALGVNALQANTSGSYNTAGGVQALRDNSQGSYNTAFGLQALMSNQVGDSNVAVGIAALGNNTIGSKNTASGHLALTNTNNGVKNTAIGYNAQVGANLTYATAIGANATVSASNALVLGGTGNNAVKVGIGTSIPQNDLAINQRPNDSAGIKLTYYTAGFNWRFCEDDTGHLSFLKNGTLRGFIRLSNGEYVKASDQKLKQDIENIEGVLPRVLQLKPKTYRYTGNNDTSPLSFGFLAQEVEPLFPELVFTKPDTGLKGLAYEEVGVIAVQAIREQQALINAQTDRLHQIEQRLRVLETRSKQK